MRTLLVIFLALLAAAALAGMASKSLGHVVFSYPGWTVEISLILFVIVLAGGFLVLYAGIRMIVQVLEVPSRLAQWRQQRRQRLAENCLATGWRALIEGDWRKAEDALIKGAPYARVPLLNYLGAARAAHKQGKLERRDRYLRQAQLENPGNEISVGLTQAELQLSRQQTEQALATLNRLHELYPHQHQVALMLLNACLDNESWSGVLDVLTGVERAQLLPGENLQAIKLRAYAGRLEHAGHTEDQEKLDQAWRTIPAALRNEPHLLAVYTLEKLKFGDAGDCEPLLRRALKKRWDGEIVRLYGFVSGKDSARQLAFTEDLLAGHGRDPVLLLTLGRLCLRNSLWGKAKAYLEESIGIEPSPEAYRELAVLLEGQGETALAASCYRQGLTLATAIARHDSVRLLEQSEQREAACQAARQVV